MAQLPVIQNNDEEQLRTKLAHELVQLTAPSGEIRFDKHNRMLYATDASIYQVEPLGVVIPGNMESVAKIVAWCGENKIAILPRGGGTSLPGQCTSHAVVVDYSPKCRQILEVDTAARTCFVEPGITVDELNRQLDQRKTGLFFAPDPATAAQCSIGGCIGNNAAGARSIRYGRTSENVTALHIALTTGERCVLEAGAGRKDPVAKKLASQVAAVVRKYEKLIAERYPKTMRRNAGYGLDLILQQLNRGVCEEDLDLSGLICGSEGTLAVVLQAKLRLHPIQRSKGLAIVSFPTLEDSIRAVVPILSTNPTAVELIDDVVLDMARGNAECRNYMDLLAEANGKPAAAVLYVEYQSDLPTLDEVTAKFAALRQVMPNAAIKEYTDAKNLARAWALRKAGEPLLHGMASHRKPVTCVEDNAVPVEHLVEFVDGFKKIVTKHGTKAAYYAHASVGVLHVRPMLDLHDDEDLARLRAIGTEVADLAKACGGVMSGEHGDGRLRGPLLERFYGRELMTAFAEIKQIFDPAGVLNPGNIVGAGPIESMTQRMRTAPLGQKLNWPHVDTYFDYSNQEGFDGAVEMCSGAGVCRKTAIGTMCPSYRATLDERHSTRGRANALRLAITGQLPSTANPGQAAWDDPETLATLSLCLSCKACKTECPSNVDVAKLKAEYLAQRYKILNKIPLQAKVFGNIRQLNKLASIAPGLANFVNNLSPVRSIMNSVLHLAPQRSLSRFETSLYSWFAKHPKKTAPTKVVLYADCFVTYNEPVIGQKTIQLLEAFGYEVLLPQVSCCGRSMMSMGMLEQATHSAHATLQALQPYIDDPSVAAVVVCEPSCLSAIKDEWLSLKINTPLPLRQKLAAKSFLVEDFLEKNWDTHPQRPAIKPNALERFSQGALLHGHCHQKSLWGDQTSAALLKRLLGDKLKTLPSGCCGMAGAFGYSQDKYELSLKIGEDSLFKYIRPEPQNAVVIAPGTSCRHQIKDGTQRTAQHPVEVVAELLGV